MCQIKTSIIALRPFSRAALFPHDEAVSVLRLQNVLADGLEAVDPLPPLLVLPALGLPVHLVHQLEQLQGLRPTAKFPVFFRQIRSVTKSLT